MDFKTYSDYMILIMKLNAENHTDDTIQYKCTICVDPISIVCSEHDKNSQSK